MKNKRGRILKQYFTILLLLILIGSVIVHISSSLLKKVAEDSITEITNLSTIVVANETQKFIHLLEKLSNLEVIKDQNTTNIEKIDVLKGFRESNNLSDVGIANLDGWLVSDRNRDGIYVGDRKYFQKAMKGETYFDGPLVSRTNKEYIIVVGKPVYNGTEISNVIVIIYKIEELSSIIDEITFMKTGNVFMLDHTGMMIANQDRSLIGSKLSEFYANSKEKEILKIEEMEGQMISSKTGFGEYTFGNTDLFIGYQPVSGTSWSLAVAVQKSDIMGIMNKLQNLLIIMIIVAGISMISVNTYFSILKRRLYKHQVTSQSAIDTASIIIIRTDQNLNILELNHHAEEKLGKSRENLIGKSLLSIMDQKNQKKLTNILKEVRYSETVHKFDLELKNEDNVVFYVQLYVNSSAIEDTEIEFMGIDISDRILAQKEISDKNEELTALYEELSASEEEIRLQCTELDKNSQILKNMAFHDALTGLPNRQNLNQVIDEMIKKSNESNQRICILFLDADNFKYINDKLGHLVGDKILIDIGHRLTNEIKDEKTTIFRIGGDEFIILREDIGDSSECVDLANRILKVIEAPFIVNDSVLHITVSVGITVFPDDCTSLEDMLKYADIAMYKAKDDGKNRYTFFHKALWEEISDKMLMEEKLRKALDRNEFILYYQPLIDLETEAIAGFEALIRWNSPADGMISPVQFISIAEKTGIIVPIGKWVLESASRFLKELQEKYHREIYMSVNVSVIQMIQKNFVDMVREVLIKTELPSEYLMLEITESVLMESYEENLEKMKLLNDMGIRFALDDFGEGYSSFGYLRKLPIKTLKMDRSFINHIEKEEDDGVTGAIVTLGHHLNLDVIAEGVENLQQVGCLKRLKCDKVQGYYYSRPVPQEEVFQLLDRTTYIHDTGI